MKQFSIRDVLWLTTLAATFLGWWGHHRRWRDNEQELIVQQVRNEERQVRMWQAVNSETRESVATQILLANEVLPCPLIRAKYGSK